MPLLGAQRYSVVVQLYPFGFRESAHNQTVRGRNLGNLALARDCAYLEWVNPRTDLAFFRRIDANR